MKINIKFFIVLLTFMLFFLFGISMLIENILLAQWEERMISELTTVETHELDIIDYYIFKQINEVAFLSKEPVLIDPAVSLSEKMDYLREVEKKTKAFASFSLYNAEGIRIADTRSTLIGLNQSDRTFFKNAFAHGSYTSDKPEYSISLT